MGDKIKTLRLEKKMTLEEMGRRCGVGKSTVRKWEVGLISNMRRDKIALVAKALDVSPAYLMGWTEEEQEVVPSIGLTPDETHLVDTYRSLDEDGRQTLITVADGLVLTHSAAAKKVEA